MPTEQENFMAQALALAAEAAAAGEVPVGCVIVRDGEIVGRGRNRREEKQATASHAEMEAIARFIADTVFRFEETRQRTLQAVQALTERFPLYE